MTCYTAIVGKYDELKQPADISMVEGWDMVCFTDQNFELPEDNVWRIVNVNSSEYGPAKTARNIKILFHKYIQDEFCLWIDATFGINVNLNEWWSRFSAPFTTIKHPFDNCIYIDARACAKLGKADHTLLKNQTDCYRKLGVKKNSGLISSGILMRQNTSKVREFCEMWWRQVEMFTHRDQISFGYCQHKMPGVHNQIEWDYTTQNEFVHIGHLHKKWRKTWNPSKQNVTKPMAVGK